MTGSNWGSARDIIFSVNETELLRIAGLTACQPAARRADSDKKPHADLIHRCDLRSTGAVPSPASRHPCLSPVPHRSDYQSILRNMGAMKFYIFWDTWRSVEIRENTLEYIDNVF